MKLLRRSQKGQETFDIMLHVERLSPWPNNHGALAVQWQRGGRKRRKGQTKPCQPDTEIGPATYTFAETLTVPATLYRNSNPKEGAFAAKMVNIYVAQVDERGKELNVLGGLELNLADFAEIRGNVRQEYALECGDAVLHGAGARPKLALTISAAHKSGKQLQPEKDGAANAAASSTWNDDATSISEFPSTLSTDDEEGSRPQSGLGFHQRRESVAASSSILHAVRESETGPGDSRDPSQAQASVAGGRRDMYDAKAEESTHNEGYESSATRSVQGPGRARMAVVATGLGASAVAMATTERVYDSDGFLIDDDAHGIIDNAIHPGVATTNASLVATSSLDTSAIKRNLGEAMEGLSPSPGVSMHAAVANSVPGNGAAFEEADQTRSPSLVSYEVVAAREQAERGEVAHRNDVAEVARDAHDDDGVKRNVSRRFSRQGGAALGSRSWAWRRQSNKEQNAEEEDRPSPRDGGLHHQRPVSSLPQEETAPPAGAVDKGPQHSGPWMALERELRVAAAIEHAIYHAGNHWVNAVHPTQGTSSARGKPSQWLSAPPSASFTDTQQVLSSTPSSSRLQAPARRIIRTIVAMGREGGGASFGINAVDAIRTSAAACLGDVHRLASWWSTAVTMRFSIWGLHGAGGATGGQNSHFAWLRNEVLPAVAAVEHDMFVAILDQLWREVLSGAVMDAYGDERSSIPSPSKQRSMAKARGTKRLARASMETNENTQHQPEGNTAVERWLHGLKAADACLQGRGRPPCVPRPLLSLLRRQVFARLMDRLDAALTANVLDDGRTNVVERVDDGLLPCPRGGPLSFGHGVDVKMALGRLVNWALDVGIKETSATEATAPVHAKPNGALPAATTSSSPSPSPLPSAPAAVQRGGDGASASFFPKLRAVGDLLMLPKGSLTNDEVRAVVAPCLSAAEICRVLRLYRAEEPSDSSFTDRLVKQLQGETTKTESKSSLPVEEYSPPVEPMLLDQGTIQPLSLDMNADSDDELTALEQASSARHEAKFSLLSELWRGGRNRYR